MLKVYTGCIKNYTPYNFDVTRKSGHLVFAPTWEIINDYKDGYITKEDYTRQYIAMLIESYENYREEWEELLQRDLVVLVCYCKHHISFCHRYILAKFLKVLGAEYLGEIDITSPPF